MISSRGILAPMWREFGMGPTLVGLGSTDVFKGWKISESGNDRSLGFNLTPISETGKSNMLIIKVSVT